MTLCEPLHDYIEKVGCDPQWVARILDDSFFDEYISDPASKQLEVAILKQQIPRLNEGLNANEFLEVYKKVVLAIFSTWIQKYFPNLPLHFFLVDLKLVVDKDSFKTTISTPSITDIHCENPNDDTNEVLFPRCISEFNLTVNHTDPRPISAPQTTFFYNIYSASTSVSIPTLEKCSTLSVPRAKKLTLGAAKIAYLELSDIEDLTIVSNLHSQILKVGRLKISEIGKQRLEAKKQFSQIEAVSITIIV